MGAYSTLICQRPLVRHAGRFGGVAAALLVAASAACLELLGVRRARRRCPGFGSLFLLRHFYWMSAKVLPRSPTTFFTATFLVFFASSA